MSQNMPSAAVVICALRVNKRGVVSWMCGGYCYIIMNFIILSLSKYDMSVLFRPFIMSFLANGDFFVC